MQFDAIYTTYEKRIYGFLVRLSGRRDVADDLFQETWLRLARHAPTLSEDTDIAAWLFTVARNLYRSHVRWSIADRLRRRDVVEAVTSTTPEIDHAWRERWQKLEAALGELPVAHREILLLVGVEAMEPQLAAQVLGISAAAARQRLSRARAALAYALGEEGTPWKI